MTNASASRDNKLYDDLITLKRHLASCRACKMARKSRTPRDLCDAGALMMLNAVDRYDVVIKLRIAAHRSKENTVFACPDLTKHGRSYALTTAPLHVVAIQEGLF